MIVEKVNLIRLYKSSAGTIPSYIKALLVHKVSIEGRIN
jgi:hypothetical protein